MAITVDSLDELTTEEVEAMAALLADQLRTRHAEVDPERGATRRILLLPAANMAQKSRTEMDRLRQSFSLVLAAANPELVDPDILDLAAGNYRIPRYPGSAASGSIVIVVSRFDPLVITRGFVVIARGLRFTTSQNYSIRTSAAAVTSADDRILTPTADGQWSFSIPVTAEEVGADGRLLRGEAVTVEIPPANYVKSYAASDFVGGVDEETTADLTERVQTGIACRSVADRVSMGATLYAEWPETVSHSIIGAGDPEMRRDQHTIFPGSFGGCIDWYIRSAELPTRTLLEREATLVEVEGTGHGIWQISISRDLVPGFYDVYKIALPGVDVVGTFEIVSDTRGRDLGELDSKAEIPDIVNNQESTYTRFQTAVIRFRDTTTSTQGLVVGESTADYDVTVRHFPYIAEMQDRFSARDYGATAGDILIRAPIPLYLDLSIVILTPPDALEIDEDSIKNDVRRLVNRLPFGQGLAGSAILDVIHRYLPTGAFVRALDMLGMIRTPSGEKLWLRDSEYLEIPDRSDLETTPRNTCFILEPEKVAISVTQLNNPIV